jgi:hypothetical protein
MPCEADHSAIRAPAWRRCSGWLMLDPTSRITKTKRGASRS